MITITPMTETRNPSRRMNRKYLTKKQRKKMSPETSDDETEREDE